MQNFRRNPDFMQRPHTNIKVDKLPHSFTNTFTYILYLTTIKYYYLKIDEMIFFIYIIILSVLYAFKSFFACFLIVLFFLILINNTQVTTRKKTLHK